MLGGMVYSVDFLFTIKSTAKDTFGTPKKRIEQW
jgi:hypothetical protein